jgi:hypothetical protein
MRQHLTIASLLSLVVISVFAISPAQEVATPNPNETESDGKKLLIVPLVAVKPGETKELILSTWCTVGVTRGGGFGLTEMRDGKPVGGGHDVKSYREGGLTISVPSFKEGVTFASEPEFALLTERHIAPFKVTVAASRDAKPGLFEMHLVDSTCAGQCKTDFRVLVVEP